MIVLIVIYGNECAKKVANLLKSKPKNPKPVIVLKINMSKKYN